MRPLEIYCQSFRLKIMQNLMDQYGKLAEYIKQRVKEEFTED